MSNRDSKIDSLARERYNLTTLTIRPANLRDAADCSAVWQLTSAYASDHWGQSAPLAEELRTQLLVGLRDHPTAMILLAFVGDAPAGIATCFRGFSTFQARPLINIHDIAVLPEFRGRGIARSLLKAVEEEAMKLGCCKVTLEVLEPNQHARSLYTKAGYKDPEYAGHVCRSLFLCKQL